MLSVIVYLSLSLNFALLWSCAGLRRGLHEREGEVDDLRNRLDASGAEIFAAREIAKVAIDTTARVYSEKLELADNLKHVYKRGLN